MRDHRIWERMKDNNNNNNSNNDNNIYFILMKHFTLFATPLLKID